MSLDYPFYEELCRRKHRAAWWWLVGDGLYYIGLLSAVLGISVSAWVLGMGVLGRGWRPLIPAGFMFLVGVAVFFIGSSLKRRAYVLAERDGISAGEVYSRGTSGKDEGAKPDDST